MLINALHQQLLRANVAFEVLCFDDAPNSAHGAKNMSLNSLEHVTYRTNTIPLGRAKNRNALAKAAQHDLLLFLDGDAGIMHNTHFISTYLNNQVLGEVCCGGTAYGEEPTDQTFLLRYVYGKSREELSAEHRQKNAWAGFSAFNFMIEKKLFQEIQFQENMLKYGHEDTLFGKALKQHQIKIKHINNTALHLGLDANLVFLAKSRQAVENLRDLINDELADHDIKLYAWYLRLHRTRMTAVIGGLFHRFKTKWEENLCSAQPSLTTFDLYRLGYLCTLPIKHKRSR